MHIDLHNLLYILASRVAVAINPILIGVILEEPLIHPRSQLAGIGVSALRRSILFYLRSSLAIGSAVLLTELGKKYQVWPGHSNFPSGHTTFAAAAATCLILQRGVRWAWFVVPIALLMAICLAYGHWHTPAEVAAALVFGPAVAVAVLRVAGLRGHA